MSALVLPTLPLVEVTSPERDEFYKTLHYESPGGTEQRVSLQSARRFRLKYKGVVRDRVAAPSPWNPYSELGVLLLFLDQHRGDGDSFLVDDPGARRNLLAYSQGGFGLSPWTNTGGVTDSTIVAPDGTMTASKIVGTLADSYFSQPFTSVAGASVSSIWAKVPAGTHAVYFTLGETGGAGNADINPTLTTSWQRFSVTNVLIGGFPSFVRTGGASSIGIGTEIHMWGAQFEYASSAGLYVPTGATPASGRVRMRFDQDTVRLRPIVDDVYEASFDLVAVLGE